MEGSLPLPPLLKALLGLLLISQVMEDPGQAIEGVSILWGHRQYPLIAGFGLAQLALVAQDRRQPGHGGQVLRRVLQDQLVLGGSSLQ